MRVMIIGLAWLALLGKCEELREPIHIIVGQGDVVTLKVDQCTFGIDGLFNGTTRCFHWDLGFDSIPTIPAPILDVNPGTNFTVILRNALSGASKNQVCLHDIFLPVSQNKTNV